MASAETIFPAMTQVDAERRKTSFRRETGGYVPRQFNAVTRERFLRDRRQKHLSRVTAPPTDAQVAQVQSLASLEWAALAAERENSLQSLREAREHRRLLMRVLADFERSITAAPPAKAPTLAEELAKAARERLLREST
jgi:hypothetical protein